MYDLRDLFAMAAMAGDICSQLGTIDQDTDDDLLERARIYYRMADAMMAVRVPRGPVLHRRRDDPKP